MFAIQTFIRHFSRITFTDRNLDHNMSSVPDLGQVIKLTPSSSTHLRRKTRQTTNPSNECDSLEKGEERNRKLNEDYNFLTFM